MSRRGVESGPIRANINQKRNKLLKHVNLTVEFEAMKPDYVIGDTCVLFLNLEYHSVHPDYIGKRMVEIGSGFNLRVLLVETQGVNDPSAGIKELTLKAMRYDMTVVVSSDEVDSAAYLRQFKLLERSTVEPLEGKQSAQHNDQFIAVLTKVRAINSSDALILGHQFGSMREILRNTKSLEGLTGIGKTKSDQLLKAVKDPFQGAPIV